MLSKKVAIASCTAESEGSANIQAARRLAFQGRASAPNMVRMGSAQRTGASPTQRKEARSVRSIPLTKWPALLKAAATSLSDEGFAYVMLDRRRSALLLDVVHLLKLVGSAVHMVPMDSALSATALQLLYLSKKEIAVGTAATAARKCARRKAAPLLQ